MSAEQTVHVHVPGGHSGEALNEFKERHFVVHSRIFDSLLTSFLTLISGFVEVRLADKDQALKKVFKPVVSWLVSPNNL